jgi:hypothetical protein
MMMNKSMFAVRRIATSRSAGLNLVRANFSTGSGEKFTDRMEKTGKEKEKTLYVILCGVVWCELWDVSGCARVF